MIQKNIVSPSILFIDSGVGGLTTLCETSRLLNANYIYFADNKFAPYGNKSDEFLKQRQSKIIKHITKKYNISLIVLACNTATTTTISHLRKQFPNLIFVGTEPAFKIASDKGFNHPAILATPQTINHLNPDITNNFLKIAQRNLAIEIENNLIYNSPKTKFDLLKSIYSIKNQTKNCDCLILGCTHYVFLKKRLEKILEMPIIDGNYGVAKQICKQYSKKNNKKSIFKIILSNKNRHSLQKYKKILRQILANQINLC